MNHAHEYAPEGRKPLPQRRDNFRPLRLYSALWRDQPGDTILGWIIAQQPVELPDGSEKHALMFQLAAPAHVILFDEGPEDRETVMQPVDKITAETFAVVAVAVDRASLARLFLLAGQPDIAHLVELTRVDRPGPRRYYCTRSMAPAKRADVDPIEIDRLAQQRAAAILAAKSAK